ncbi:MAG: FUSC family protein [Hyphomicrobiales bacterium]
MTDGTGEQAGRADGGLARLSAALPNALRAAGPPLLFGLRLWASVSLALHVAFWLELDDAFWAGTTAALVCQPHLGASLRKGWYRMIGTLVGATAIVVLTACFPQDRSLFLVGLALWGAACTLVGTLLRNFAAYSAALAGFTAAIIASDQLGATGGPNGQAFMLAVTRVSEICIGIVSAGMVLAGTDFGSARRRLAETFAVVSVEIAGRFTRTLAQAGSDLSYTQPVRRELYRRVIALDPTIDEAKGESAEIRYHSPVLQAAVDGLFAALAGWRTVAMHLTRSPDHAARQEADVVLQRVPQALRSALGEGEPTRWMADPIRLHRLCEAGIRVLIDLPAGTPSLRLLADQTAKVLGGVSDALEGLALLVADPTRVRSRGRSYRLHVPDWLPALVNAGRAFVAIGAMEVFWIVTAWPNGALAITFTAICVVLFAPRADQAYQVAMSFMVGTALAAVFAAIVAFAVLPKFETFAGLSAVMALYLVPVGALLAQPWQTAMFAAMAGNFVPILAPANEMTYDTLQFYNSTLAIVAGCGAAALSFRLIPPLSPAFRTRRFLALSLGDLRRVTTGSVPRTPEVWEGHMYGRLAALPDEAEPLQRGQLIAALSVGTEIIHLRQTAPRLGLAAQLDVALEAFAQGNSAIAIARLSQLDRRLASWPEAWPEMAIALRARGHILAISDALAEHASYFDAGARA